MINANVVPKCFSHCYHCQKPWETIQNKYDIIWYFCSCGAKLRREIIRAAKKDAPDPTAISVDLPTPDPTNPPAKPEEF